ncbi:MAG TPA: hypothetical protein VK157_05245 [Phycisphaerales bacterium]|nr:hypothetical protein [Phycisphaerales bacterium]
MSVLVIIAMYLGLGAIFAPGFVIWGVRRIDATAASAGWVVRCMWAPGAMLLWPVLLYLWWARRRV